MKMCGKTEAKSAYKGIYTAPSCVHSMYEDNVQLHWLPLLLPPRHIGCVHTPAYSAFNSLTLLVWETVCP